MRIIIRTLLSVSLFLGISSAQAFDICSDTWWKKANYASILRLAPAQIKAANCKLPLIHKALLIARLGPREISYLVKAGANPNARNSAKENALHVTASPLRKMHSSKRIALFEILVKGGGHINARDQHGDTPLHKALEFHRKKVIEALLDRGADINAENNYKITPLHVAAEYNENPEVIRLLLRRGADIHAVDIDGQTPLHKAAMFNSSEINAILLDHKNIKVNAKDSMGNIPLHLAALSNINYKKKFRVEGSGKDVRLKAKKDADLKHQVADAHLKAGADVHAKNRDERTPFHRAAKFNNFDFVTTLLKGGADLKARDRFGKTPVDLAKYNRLKDMHKYLVGIEANSAH